MFEDIGGRRQPYLVCMINAFSHNAPDDAHAVLSCDFRPTPNLSWHQLRIRPSACGTTRLLAVSKRTAATSIAHTVSQLASQRIMLLAEAKTPKSSFGIYKVGK